MIELFTIGITVINLAISTVTTMRYLSVVLGDAIATRIAFASALFTGAWIGILGLWLGWWPFLAAMSVLGFFGVIHHAKKITELAREHKYQQWVAEHERWMNAKPTNNEPPREFRVFDPDPKLLN